MDQLLLYCCDKTLRQRKFIEVRVYLGLAIPESYHDHGGSMAAGRLGTGAAAENSPSDSQAGSRGCTVDRGGFNSLNLSPVTPLSTMPHSLIFPIWLSIVHQVLK